MVRERVVSHASPDGDAELNHWMPHTHIHQQGLGLDAATGAVLPIGAGLVGQEKAREAAGIVVELIKYVKQSVG